MSMFSTQSQKWDRHQDTNFSTSARLLESLKFSHCISEELTRDKFKKLRKGFFRGRDLTDISKTKIISHEYNDIRLSSLTVIRCKKEEEEEKSCAHLRFLSAKRGAFDLVNKIPLFWIFEIKQKLSFSFLDEQNIDLQKENCVGNCCYESSD